MSNFKTLRKQVENNDKDLRNLDLGKQGLKDSDMAKLAAAFKKNDHVLEVKLSSNQITATGVKHLAGGLEGNVTVQNLILDNNKLGDKGAEELGKLLANHPSIIKLNLNHNQIGDIGVQILVIYLKRNTTITEIFLENNEFGDASITALMGLLDSNQTILDIKFDHNPAVSHDMAEQLKTKLQQRQAKSRSRMERQAPGTEPLPPAEPLQYSNSGTLRGEAPTLQPSGSGAFIGEQPSLRPSGSGAFIREQPSLRPSGSGSLIGEQPTPQTQILAPSRSGILLDMAPLFRAAAKGDMKVLNDFLTQNVNFNTQSPKTGLTVLHVAIKYEQTAFALELLRYDFDINLRDNNGQTPLHIAAEKNNAEVTEALLSCNDIDLDPKDNNGKTPLLVAIANFKSTWNLKAIGLLLDAKASIGSTEDCTDALYFVVGFTHSPKKMPLIELLIGRGADPDSISNYVLISEGIEETPRQRDVRKNTNVLVDILGSTGPILAVTRAGASGKADTSTSQQSINPEKAVRTHEPKPPLTAPSATAAAASSDPSGTQLHYPKRQHQSAPIRSLMSRVYGEESTQEVKPTQVPATSVKSTGSREAEPTAKPAQQAPAKSSHLQDSAKRSSAASSAATASSASSSRHAHPQSSYASSAAAATSSQSASKHAAPKSSYVSTAAAAASSSANDKNTPAQPSRASTSAGMSSKSASTHTHAQSSDDSSKPAVSSQPTSKPVSAKPSYVSTVAAAASSSASDKNTPAQSSRASTSAGTSSKSASTHTHAQLSDASGATAASPQSTSKPVSAKPSYVSTAAAAASSPASGKNTPAQLSRASTSAATSSQVATTHIHTQSSFGTTAAPAVSSQSANKQMPTKFSSATTTATTIAAFSPAGDRGAPSQLPRASTSVGMSSQVANQPTQKQISPASTAAAATSQSVNKQHVHSSYTSSTTVAAAFSSAVDKHAPAQVSHASPSTTTTSSQVISKHTQAQLSSTSVAAAFSPAASKQAEKPKQSFPSEQPMLNLQHEATPATQPSLDSANRKPADTASRPVTKDPIDSASAQKGDPAIKGKPSLIPQEEKKARLEVSQKQLAGYGINYKKTTNYNLPTEVEVQSLLEAKKPTQTSEFVGEKMQHLHVDEAIMESLINAEYTREEIDAFIKLGITPVLIKKLQNPNLELSISESIQCIGTCIAMGKVEAEKVKGLSKGLTVNLILGGTGVGKSTAVNWLHGCEMEAKKMKSGYRALVKKDSPIASIVEIGHTVTSKTLIPSTVISKTYDGSEVVYCDFPGSDDSRGFEVNISNAVNTRHLIENADYIKIIVLITYEDTKEVRFSEKSHIVAIINVLDNLFGSSQSKSFARSLEALKSSVIIGVTKVPRLADNDENTIESIKERIHDLIPSQLGIPIKILDPLYGRGTREEWLQQIHLLQPVENHKQRVNTVLNAEDKINLIAISEEISRQIALDLNNKEYEAAGQKLEQMNYLRIIGHSQIEKLYEQNFQKVMVFARDQEREIRQYADDYDFSTVEKKLADYQWIIMLFKEAAPELRKMLLDLLTYVNQKEIEFATNAAYKAIEEFVKYFYQNEELQKNLAYSLHVLLNQSQPSIKDEAAIPNLPWYLREIAGLDRHLGARIEKLSNCLAELSELEEKYQKRNMSLLEDKLQAELIKIGRTAWSTYRKNAVESLTNIKVIVLQQLDQLEKKIEWQVNGRKVLQIMGALTNEAEFEDIMSILKECMKEKSIQLETENIHQNLTTVEQIILTIITDLDGKTSAEDIPVVVSVILEKLLFIKSKMLAEQTKEEERIRKEKEKQEAQYLLRYTKEVIEAGKTDVLKNIFIKFAEFNGEQKNIFLQSNEINLQLTNKLQAVLSQLDAQIDWEKNGKKVFGIIGVIEINNLGENVIPLEKCFSDLKNVPGLEQVTQQMSFIFAFLNEAKGKLPIQLDSYSKMIKDKLSAIRSELLKAKVKEDRQKEEERLREEEEQKRKEAGELVVLINQVLLNSDRFDELKIAITRILQIAPTEVEKISLKPKINEALHFFHAEFNGNNFKAAKDKYALLKRLHGSLGEILTQLGVSLNLSALEATVNDFLSKVKKDVLDEVKDAFSEANIIRVDSPIKILSKTGDFFNVINNFKSQIPSVEQYLDTVIKECCQSIDNIYSRFLNIENHQIFARLLLQTQHLISEIGPRCASFATLIKKYMGDAIASVDDEFSARVCSFLDRAKSGDIEDASRYASEIIESYPKFVRASKKERRKKMFSRTAEDVLHELELSDKEVLKTCYRYYHEEYEPMILDIIQNFKTPAGDKILSNAIKKAKEHGERLASTDKLSKQPELVGRMVANIFGVWAYLDACKGGFKGDRYEINEPHAAQVISVLLLLGMSNANASIGKVFLEVKTGEGKSILVAAGSIAFALLGYQVDVACHNPWLAKRDKNDFKDLFNSFSLNKMISYGSFDSHVNKHIANLGDLRSLVGQFLRGEAVKGSVTRVKKSVLLVDEVDVFFSDKFLGKTYNPAERLYSKNYISLLKEVWNKRKEYLAMNRETFVQNILSHSLMKSFLKEYPKIQPFINRFIENMYYSLGEVNAGRHTYIVSERSIYYLDSVANTITNTSSYGHLTAFAAVKEYLNKAVSEECLEDKANIMFGCGQFSFAELPKFYDHIMGVTGTLMTLSDFENDLLKEYGITRKIVIPSLYNKKPLKGGDKVLICDGKKSAEAPEGYYNSIKQAVEKAVKKGRAVLIVFDTLKRIERYQRFIEKHHYTAKGLDGKRDVFINPNSLVPTTGFKARNFIVSEATSYFKVTQMVREYGRGSDFVCRDPRVRKNNGVKVICTFFPEHEAEEKQIKGRTCRQDDPGSYKLIVHLKDLKEFGIDTMDNIASSQLTPYQCLVQKRKEFQAKKGDTTRKNLQSAKEAHDLTLNLASQLTHHTSFFSKLLPPSQKRDEDPMAILTRLNR